MKKLTAKDIKTKLKKAHKKSKSKPKKKHSTFYDRLPSDSAWLKD